MMWLVIKTCFLSQMLPIVEQLANPALKERHWRGVFALLGADRAVSTLPFWLCYDLEFVHASYDLPGWSSCCNQLYVLVIGCVLACVSHGKQA